MNDKIELNPIERPCDSCAHKHNYPKDGSFNPAPRAECKIDDRRLMPRVCLEYKPLLTITSNKKEQKLCAQCGLPAFAYVFHKRFDGELHPAKYCRKHLVQPKDSLPLFEPSVVGYLTLDLQEALDLAWKGSTEKLFDPQNPPGDLIKLCPTKVNKEIVDTLRKMLEEAEKGELLGLAYVGAYKGKGTYSRGLYGDMMGQQLLFGLTQLQYRIVSEANKE